jgi:hypothetical protein
MDGGELGVQGGAERGANKLTRLLCQRLSLCALAFGGGNVAHPAMEACNGRDSRNRIIRHGEVTAHKTEQYGAKQCIGRRHTCGMGGLVPSDGWLTSGELGLGLAITEASNRDKESWRTASACLCARHLRRISRGLCRHGVDFLLRQQLLTTRQAPAATSTPTKGSRRCAQG